jgi:hypothetical protein
MSYLSRAYGAAKLTLSANAPTIMVASGIVAMSAGTVIACKKTVHLEEVLNPHTSKLEEIKRVEEDVNRPDYTTDKAREYRFVVYRNAGWDCTKLYAVPGVIFISGVALVIGGHRIMLKRNATLALAFTGLKQAFDAYRSRVRDEMGSDFDQAMYTGYKVVRHGDVDPDATNPEAMINTRDWENARLDPYNRVFEQGASKEWHNDLGLNKMFLSQQQRFAQQRLDWQDHLYLSEIYEALGFPETDISRVVGWKVRRLPDGTRDIPLVDFGLDKPHPDDWKYNQENAVYLDFNCQGLIIGGKVQKILENS